MYCSLNVTYDFVSLGLGSGPTILHPDMNGLFDLSGTQCDQLHS